MIAHWDAHTYNVVNKMSKGDHRNKVLPEMGDYRTQHNYLMQQ